MVEMMVVVWKYKWEDIRVERSVWEKTKKKKNEKRGREWAGQRVKRWVKMSGGEGD